MEGALALPIGPLLARSHAPAAHRPSTGRRRLPREGKGHLGHRRPPKLRVEASDRWRLIIEEELRTPLQEPPLPAIRSARALAAGSFYPIEIKGRGTASLYRLRDGRLALRMERFGTEPNPSLAVWLSQAQAPSTTKQAFDAPHTEIAPLKSTIGDQNYLLPRGLDPQKIRSVVVWNKPSRIAHTAATLRPQTRCIPRRDTAHPVSTPETSDP